MNIIKLSSNELKMIESLKPVNIDHFIFDDFEIRTAHAGMLLTKVNLYEGTSFFQFSFPIVTLPEGKVDYYPLLAINDGISVDDEISANITDFEKVKKLVKTIRQLVFYIMTCQRNRKEKYPIPRKYSREHRISTIQNKVYLLDDIVKYVHDNYVPQEGTHNIQCECWGVRGHYRTYKSGKQVWINAYKKGKKRQEMEPKDKTYYLSKGERV